MSIATALTALADDVSAAKAAITAKGGTAPIGTADMADAIAAIPSGGITPTGNINITDTNVTDVTNYATATVVSENLTAENIKKNIDILGIIGTFEGGGGGGIDVKSAARCEIVTVGANTVTNPVDAVSYFGYTATYPGLAIILLDTPNSNNQFGFVTIRKDATQTGAANTPWWRWRSGSFNWPSTFNNSWDTYLVEGTKYLVIEW